MGRLRKRFDRRFIERGRHTVTSEDRQALADLGERGVPRLDHQAERDEVFATGFLGRATTEGIEFDEQVRSALSLASAGSESAGLAILAKAVAHHDVTISLDELTTFARLARSVDLHEDQWAFVGACVKR